MNDAIANRTRNATSAASTRFNTGDGILRIRFSPPTFEKKYDMFVRDVWKN